MNTPEARLVLETNVLVRAVLFPASVPAQVYRLAEILGPILTSDAAFQKMVEVLQRSKFDRF